MKANNGFCCLPEVIREPVCISNPSQRQTLIVHVLSLTYRIDPVKVTRSALQNAASIAALVLTTETLVVEKPEKKAAANGGGGHGHDDYGM